MKNNQNAHETSKQKPERKPRSLKAINRIETVAYTLPAILVIAAMIFVPFCLSMAYSFMKWNGVSSEAVFVGLANYKKALLHDAGFRQSVIFTFEYTVAYFVISNVLALLLAAALSRKMHLASLLRTVFFIPYVMSMAIVGFIWKFIFTQGFSSLYDLFGWKWLNYSWLGSPNLVYYSVVLVGVWYSLGFYIVLYIAGLKSIPNDVLEASEIDGAGAVRRFFSIKLPLLMPSICTCTLLSVTSGLQVFDVIMTMTKGGPGTSSMSLTYGIYQEAFTNQRYGLAAAKSVLYFIVIMILTQLILKGFRKKEVDL